eukprot:g76617.t1
MSRPQLQVAQEGLPTMSAEDWLYSQGFWTAPNPDAPMEAHHSAPPPRARHKILLLFDLNGTLTSLSEVRKKKGVRTRPGCQFLPTLQKTGRFLLAVWSSAVKHNVEKMCAQLYREHGVRFDFLLHRDHCQHLPFGTKGKHWDTRKPLAKLFLRAPGLAKTLLIDDDPEKVSAEERANLINIQKWGVEELPDNQLELLVEGLLHMLAAHAAPIPSSPQAPSSSFSSSSSCSSSSSPSSSSPSSSSSSSSSPSLSSPSSLQLSPSSSSSSSSSPTSLQYPKASVPVSAAAERCEAPTAAAASPPAAPAAAAIQQSWTALLKASQAVSSQQFEALDVRFWSARIEDTLHNRP